MKKICAFIPPLQGLLAAALLIGLLAGCGGRREQEVEESLSGETPLVSEEEPAVEKPVPTPGAELVNPEEITIYQSHSGSDIFTTEVYPVSAPEDVTLLDVVGAVEACLGVEIPVQSITQQKGMVVVDLEERFIEEHDKAGIYQILTTLGATIQQNHRTFEWIQYQLGGEAGIFGEAYEIPPLKLLEGDTAEFAAIRMQIPYEGLHYYPIENHLLETDETGRRLADYLSLLDLVDREIDAVTDIKNQDMLANAVFATRWYTTDQNYEGYRPELKPFEAPASEYLGMLEQQFWLKEHVEESIRLLYGDGVAFTHEDFGAYHYLELLGVYTPPHMGGGSRTIPIIFGYEDQGDFIQAEVAYVVEAMGGYMAPGTWEGIPEDKLMEYVETGADRYVVTVKKLPDDWFLLERQTLK